MSIDRKAVNVALAKACAFQQCGKQRETERWAAELVRLLGCAGILSDGPVGPNAPGPGSRPVPVKSGHQDGYCPHGEIPGWCARCGGLDSEIPR